MPANSKYLTASPWQRFAKISAAIVGGYLATTAIHLAFAAWVDHVIVLITSTFSGFILWTVFMVLAFLGKNGWNVWLLYLGIILVFSVIAFLGKSYNPDFMR